MKRLGRFIFIVLCLILSACAFKTNKLTSRNTELVAMLSDPVIREDFRHLKAAARNANLYKINGRIYFADADIKTLNAISSDLVKRLRYEYHLTSANYKVHTFIGKNEYNSCYEYYNSYYSHSIGKSCHEFTQDFASCDLCNNYVKTVRSRKFSIIHTVWWNNEKTMNLVDTFKLKNGDPVYMGLEISVE